MKSFIIVWLLVITGVIQTHAQGPMLQVLNTTGASTSGSTGIIVEYSIGEPMTLTANSSGSPSVTQGFEQPFYGISNTAEAFDEKYTIKCYPNPVNELLNIETDFKGFQEYRIFSMNGEMVTSGKFDYTPIHLSSLPFGNYILTFSFKNQSLTKSINIIKQ